MLHHRLDYSLNSSLIFSATFFQVSLPG